MSAYTPMIQQYLDIKKENPDCILFFRLGDFYEMFFDDALTASKALEIVLTKRDCGGGEKCPMCGIPYHVSDQYISKLISKNYKVAICEQLEDPKQTNGLVKRGIVQIVSPGTIIKSNLDESSGNNYIAGIYNVGNTLHISYGDISTGEFNYTSTNISSAEDAFRVIDDELARIMPSEVVIANGPYVKNEMLEKINSAGKFVITVENCITNEEVAEIINDKSNVSLNDTVVDDYISLGMLLRYISRYMVDKNQHIRHFNRYYLNEFLNIDSHTIVNLELQKNLFTGNKKGSLLGVLDKTGTSMGARLLRQFIEKPLMDKNEILKRQNVIDELFNNISSRIELVSMLKKVYDLERIIGKLSLGKANGRDLLALKYSLEMIPSIKQLLLESSSAIIVDMGNTIDTVSDMYNLIDSAIVEEPPITITDGGLIKIGFDNDLDLIRNNKILGKEKLIKYEAEEKEKYGIKNYKIIFNKKLGYFIDITKSNIKNVPGHYIRKQTLTNSERYTTIELEEIQQMILSSDDEIKEMEYDIFSNIRTIILEQVDRIQRLCNIISWIDVATSLATVAYENGYVKPEINTLGIIELDNGRHPVIENRIGRNNFITNNVRVGNGNDNIQIVTGPNMSGKSTYLRMVAIIVIMAQIGSFVPCEAANISIVDKIFTRIGASDNLYKGDSTFMVEMNEMSNIIKNATSSSLLVLDEVGRGTSTYDGLSIAWAIVEYISKNIKSKTFFATHYHELTELDKTLKNVVNLKVEIEELKSEIIFLRKIIRGKSDKSYGIEVAKLAGLPKQLTDRAKNILKSIDKTDNNLEQIDNYIHEQVDFTIHGKELLIEKIKDININELTPLDSFNILNELINSAKQL